MSKKNFLGLVASHRRSIQSGTEFDSYFPSAELKGEIINDNGSVKDTVRLMADFVMKFKADTEKIAPVLKGATLEDTCRNIWHFLYNHIQYRLDKDGVEQLRRPCRAWHDRRSGIDCDCFSIFAGSILYNLGINFKFRITKYGAGWQHVYVVVPNKGREIIIDCVLDQFNYEKSYTEKSDYDMSRHSLSGIPIEMLSGLTSSEVDNELTLILSGADFEGVGFGDASAQSQMDALYNHLVRTRDYIQKNPASVLMAGGAKNNLDMLNYAIKYWNTPKRDEALRILEEAEEKLNTAAGMNGCDYDAENVNGIGKLEIGKKFFAKVKDAAEKVKEVAGNVGDKVKEAAQKAVQAVAKYNPLSLAARGGFLLAMKINLFKMAEKLVPGYYPEPKDPSGNKVATGFRVTLSDQDGGGSVTYTWSEWNSAHKAVEKIEHMFVNVLKGEQANLRKAIMEGRGSRKWESLHGFVEGLGDPATIAAVTAGSTPIIAAAKSMDEAGVESGDGKKFGAKIGDFFKKAGGKIKDLFAKGKEKADGNKSLIDKAKGVFKKGDSGEGEDTTTTTTIPDDGTAPPPPPDEKGFFTKAGEWVKENPGKSTAIALTTAAVITFAVSKKARQAVFGGSKRGKSRRGKKSGLSGVRRFKAGHVVKRPKKFLPKGAKVKSVTLKGSK